MAVMMNGSQKMKYVQILAVVTVEVRILVGLKMLSELKMYHPNKSRDKKKKVEMSEKTKGNQFGEDLEEVTEMRSKKGGVDDLTEMYTKV